MKKYLTITFFTLAAVLMIGAGCGQTNNAQLENKNEGDAIMEEDGHEDGAVMEDEKTGDSMMEDGKMTEGKNMEEGGMVENGKMMEEGTMMEDKHSYTGTVLAGETAKLYDFNKADYESSLKTDNLIVLYFYAKWCPTCKKETADALYPAFNELNNENVIGFRVNYNDTDTDSNEKDLAREFGVAYQHTKVFVKNNEIVLKSPESWDKDRYLSEISKAL